MVIPATFLMGFSFPVLQRVVHTDLVRIGRRVGTLLLANVVGSMVGAMLTGLVLLDVMGTAGMFRLLTVVGGTFAVCALLSSARLYTGPAEFRARAHSSLGMAGAGVAASLGALGLAVVTPGQATLWSAVHGAEPADVIFGEDGSGVSVLKTRQRGYEGKVFVFVNGLSESSIPYGDSESGTPFTPRLALCHP